VGLIARTLEEAGIPTTTVSAARDITAAVKPPRAVFVNFPLGHTTGAPLDAPLQTAIVRAALDRLVEAKEPGVILDLPCVWPADPAWESKGWP
jgi:D-proline reductase (dithiol) PrdB